MKKIEHTNSWKKPTGVLKALNAFEKNDENRNSIGKKNWATAEKIRRNRAKFQALNIFNSGNKMGSPSQNASTRLRKTGTMKAVNTLKSNENHTQQPSDKNKCSLAALPGKTINKPQAKSQSNPAQKSRWTARVRAKTSPTCSRRTLSKICFKSPCDCEWSSL